MPTQSLATRRIVESFQRGTALKDFRAASAAANRADLATAPGGNDYNTIQEFETKVNASDYPKELKDLYYLGKSKGDYKDFNEAVTKHNADQQAKQAEFEKKIDSQDYPEELRKAYKEAKSKGDLTSFNDTVDKYNAKQKQAVEAFEKVVNSPDYPPELKEAYDKSKKADDFKGFNDAVKTYNDNQQNEANKARENAIAASGDNTLVTPVNIPSAREISDLKSNINNMPPEYQDAYRSYVEGLERAASDTVQVGTSAGKPEYISKYDYDKIAAADKVNGTKYLDVLKEKGVTGLNATMGVENEQYQGQLAKYEKDQAKFEKSINDPEYPAILRDIYNRDKKTGDFTNFNNAIQSWNITTAKQQAEFERNYHMINGQGITKEDWNKLPQSEKDYATKYGFDKYFETYNPAYALYNASLAQSDEYIAKVLNDMRPFKDKDGNYDIENYIRYKALGSSRDFADNFRDNNGDIDIFTYREKLDKMNAEKKQPFDYNAVKSQLLNAGFDKEAVDLAVYNAKLNTPQKFWQASTPWNEKKGEKATVGGSLQMAVDFAVPFVYTARNWNNLSNGNKLWFLAIDAYSILNPAMKAGSVAARSVAGTATRAGTMAAFARGAALGGARAIVPIDLVLHPLGTAKASAADLRTLAEDLANPKKLPIMSVYTSEGTVRLNVTKDMTTAEAKIARDKLMEAVQKGEKVVVELKDGRTIELRRAAIMKELPGSFATATPQGERFEFGNMVEIKFRNGQRMPGSEQGIFFSPDPLTRFTKTSAFGKAGEQSTIFICSPKTAQKLISTGKLYDSYAGLVAEMERKLPVGEKTLPVGQRLYTRLADGTRVNIWLEEGIKLSPTQIAKLKAKGILETLTAPFSPALKIKGKGLTSLQVKELASELRRVGARAESRNLLRAEAQRSAARAAVPRVTLRAGQGIQDLTRRQAGYRESVKAKPAERVRTDGEREGERRIERPPEMPRRGDIITPRRGSRLVTDYTRIPDRFVEGNESRLTDFESRARVEGQPRRLGTAKNLTSRVDTVNKRTPTETRRTTMETPRTPEAPRKPEPPRNRVLEQSRTPDQPRRPEQPRTPREPFTPKYPDHTTTVKNKDSDKQKRSEIENAKYSVGYRLGELKGKPVWHVHVSNGDQWQRVIVIGRSPKGVKYTAEGAQSAYKTIQSLTRKNNISSDIIREDIGAFTTTINTGRRRPGLKFARDNSSSGSKLPITPFMPRISPRTPRISPRMPRITPKAPRITPPMPRLPR